MSEPLDIDISEKLAGELVTFLSVLAATALSNLSPEVHSLVWLRVAECRTAETTEAIELGSLLVSRVMAQAKALAQAEDGEASYE